jgi:hypothetical protein
MDTSKTRIVDLKHDLPAEWEKLISEDQCNTHCPNTYEAQKQQQNHSYAKDANNEDDGTTICLCLDRERFFPWHRKSSPARVNQVDLIVQSCDGGVEFEKIEYWVGANKSTSVARLIEDCLVENTYKAELSLNVDQSHELKTWKVKLPSGLNKDAIYFLVHYYYETGSDGECHSAQEKMTASRKDDCHY